MQPDPTTGPQDSGDDAPTDASEQSPQRDPDSTWGLGSASALDSLRRQNYRGRRSPARDDRPSSQ